MKLKLVLIFQDARQKFRSVLVEATVKLDELVKKIGKAVDESKPYWEARRLARQVSPLWWKHQELGSSGVPELPELSELFLKLMRKLQKLRHF